jgi:hypothetical protein
MSVMAMIILGVGSASTVSKGPDQEQQ